MTKKSSQSSQAEAEANEKFRNVDLDATDGGSVNRATLSQEEIAELPDEDRQQMRPV